MNFREAAIGGTIPETAKYREMLKKMHPLQMLSSNIVIPLFEISYSYTTIRGNHKNAKKYVFLQDHEEIDIEIELLMKDWVEETGDNSRSLLDGALLFSKGTGWFYSG